MEGRNNGVMLSLDSCPVSQFLPLHTGYEFSPWIRQMLGLTISLFPYHLTSWPTPSSSPKSGGWRLRDTLKHEEIHLGHFWALGKFLVLFSLSKEEYCKHPVHTGKQTLDLKPQLWDLLRVTCDLYFTTPPFDENRCYLSLTPRHLELGKFPAPT